MTTVEQITPPCAQHGEGPIWDAEQRCLHWVDMLRGDVLSLRLSGGIERRHVATVASAIRLRRTGGLVVGVERGFALVDGADGAVHVLPDQWADPNVRMNDGACDPQGRFYCGSMSYDGTPGCGGLYRLDPDGTVACVLDGISISNGLAWTGDGETVAYVDSPTHRVDAYLFDSDSGLLSDRRTLLKIEPEVGMPDGIAIDAEGGIWVALWGGGAVHRYSAEGVLDHVLSLPVRNVTACALVDGTLFITTSAIDDRTDGPAGALFRTEVGILGAPIGAFDG